MSAADLALKTSVKVYTERPATDTTHNAIFTMSHAVLTNRATYNVGSVTHSSLPLLSTFPLPHDILIIISINLTLMLLKHNY